MRVFTIHLRRHGLDPDRDVVVLRDSFSWPAMLAGGLWALWHRMWWVAAALLIVSIGTNWMASLVFSDPITPAVFTVALAILTGLLAHDLRAWALQRQGFVMRAVVVAGCADQALKRYLSEDRALADAFCAAEAIR